MPILFFIIVLNLLRRVFQVKPQRCRGAHKRRDAADATAERIARSLVTALFYNPALDDTTRRI